MKKITTIIKELKKLQPGVEWLPIGDVIQNPINPRKISEEDYESLKVSITSFPAMMTLRPGVIDANNVLQGNNQRHRACVALGWPEFPVIRANGLTPAQLKEFMIKDNMSSGAWDTESIFKDWDLDDLKEWNFDMDILEVTAEIDEEPKPERLKHQKKINLTYTEDECEKTKARLAAIAETPELAVKKLLEFWEAEYDNVCAEHCPNCDERNEGIIDKCRKCGTKY